MTQTTEEREVLLALAAKGLNLARQVENANRPAEMLLLARQIETISVELRGRVRAARRASPGPAPAERVNATDDRPNAPPAPLISDQETSTLVERATAEIPRWEQVAETEDAKRRSGGNSAHSLQSSLHGIIDQAHRYADEPERVRLAEFDASVRGDNGDHAVRFSDGRLSCDCAVYKRERLCAHVLTVERLLKSLIPANAAPFPGAR